MRSRLASWSRRMAFERGRLVGLYRRLCNPDGAEWAAFLKAQDFLYEMGEHCSIQTNVVITDPKYVRMGSNVRLSGCTLFGHDGSVNMINRAYGVCVDRAGQIDLKDNTYVGHGAIILPGVAIGPNAIVAAGAVVSRDVPENTVAGGIPARRVCSLDEHVERLVAQTESLPWNHLIQARGSEFDPEMQPEIDRIRIQSFFGSPVRH